MVYALVPKDDSLEELRAHRAGSLAESLLKSADHSMKLEAQGLAKSELERQRQLLAESLLLGSPRKLWEE